MNKKNTFSIIIPTYNNCESLCQTVEKILHQTYDSYEIIIVNDGSTDNTRKYFEKKNQKKIKLINQKNSGVSCARNTGMKAASGEYIIFVDDDDELEPTALQKLSSIIKSNNPDIVRFSGYSQNKDGKEKVICNPCERILDTKKDKTRIIKYLFNPSQKIDCYVWLIAIKNTNDLPMFNEKMAYLEDEKFYIDNFLLPGKKILITNECLYHYRYNPKSKTKNINNYRNNIDDLMISKTELQKSRVVNEEISKMITANVFKILFSRYRDVRKGMNIKDNHRARKYLLKSMKKNGIRWNNYFRRKATIKYILLKTHLI